MKKRLSEPEIWKCFNPHWGEYDFLIAENIMVSMVVGFTMMVLILVFHHLFLVMPRFRFFFNKDFYRWCAFFVQRALELSPRKVGKMMMNTSYILRWWLGCLRPSKGTPMVNKPWIRPYFWGGTLGGPQVQSINECHPASSHQCEFQGYASCLLWTSRECQRSTPHHTVGF